MGSQGVTALNLFKVTVTLLITGTYVLCGCINTVALSRRPPEAVDRRRTCLQLIFLKWE